MRVLCRYNDYYAYYAPDFALHFATNATMENQNNKQYVDSVKQQVLENLRMLQAAPGVAMEQMPHMHTAEDRGAASGLVERAAHPAEYYDGASR